MPVLDGGVVEVHLPVRDLHRHVHVEHQMGIEDLCVDGAVGGRQRGQVPGIGGRRCARRDEGAAQLQIEDVDVARFQGHQAWPALADAQLPRDLPHLQTGQFHGERAGRQRKRSHPQPADREPDRTVLLAFKRQPLDREPIAGVLVRRKRTQAQQGIEDRACERGGHEGWSQQSPHPSTSLPATAGGVCRYFGNGQMVDLPGAHSLAS